MREFPGLDNIGEVIDLLGKHFEAQATMFGSTFGYNDFWPIMNPTLEGGETVSRRLFRVNETRAEPCFGRVEPAPAEEEDERVIGKGSKKPLVPSGRP